MNESLKQIYRELRKGYYEIFYAVRKIKTETIWRSRAKNLSSSENGLQLHLGCGDKHYNWMLNCEFRATKAADVVMDCSSLKRFENNSSTLIFSHAFFEHLYKKQQLPLLKDCNRVLKDDGLLIFIGLPDFEIIADAYLKKLPGIKSDIFDLYHVYRYSHGDPEIAPDYWNEQLHKSLFDKESLSKLVKDAGFNNIVMFNYCYPNETIPLNLGVIASKAKTIDEDTVKKALLPFKENYSDINEILNKTQTI